MNGTMQRATWIVLVTGFVACEQRQSMQDRRPDPSAASRFAVPVPGGRSIADVAEQVTPSVVSVVSIKSAQGSGRHEYSLGSGVIVSADGMIITNSHVVAEATKIAIGFKDGRAVEAKLVGSDPKSDIAVVRVDKRGLPPIRVADSANMRIGDVVLAVGNPFGIGQTVTMGIVSAVSHLDLGLTDYDDFIQTDAAVNPGNSGGALVNMDGELIGINTAIVSRNGASQGIAFAIPSHVAIRIKDALMAHGRVIRGWLGVEVEDLDEDVIAIDIAGGVLVDSVIPNSPASQAGLERGDVITGIDGVAMRDVAQVRKLVAMTATGMTVQLAVRHDGEGRSIAVKIVEQPASLPSASAADQVDESEPAAAVSKTL